MVSPVTVIDQRPAAEMPGPSTKFFGIDNLLIYQRDPLAAFEHYAAYGDASHVALGLYHLYFFNHPDYIHDILVTQADKFNRWSRQKEVVGKVVGNGTFNADGDQWRKQRKLVQPAFHHKRIQTYADVMIRETQRLIDSWQTGQEYDLAHEMLKVTMAIIAQTMFGADVQGMEATISHALTVCMETETRQMEAIIKVPDWLPLPRKLAFRRAIKTFDDLIYGFIRARRATGEDTGDLLSMLLLAADEEHGGTMTDREVRDEALTLFSAGHETTANTLTWTWHLLAQYPEVEAKMVEEIERVLVIARRPCKTCAACPTRKWCSKNRSGSIPRLLG